MKKIFASLLMALMVTAALSFSAYAADTENPSDVENLKVTALNKAVKLTWDAATDDTAVTGYKVFWGEDSVNEEGKEYQFDKDVGDVIQYTLAGLENGKKYYFNVVAYDAEDNESANWAFEQDATPSADAGESDDTIAPQVASAEALNKEQVKIVFSEAIVLPTEDPQDAFSIENDDTLESLTVTNAEIDLEDRLEKTVILTTEAQEKDASYKLTVGVDVEDKAGNPMISGTSDTALFTASDTEKPAEDQSGPEVVKVTVVDNTTIMVTFNEAVVLSIDPSEDFSIMEEDDATKTLDVLGVELGTNAAGVEDTVATVTTEPQEDKSYIVTVSNLKDEAGNVVNAVKGSATFRGIPSDGGSTEDKTPPMDIGNLMAEAVLQANKYLVKLTWDLVEDNDSVSQLVYKSTDGAKYDKETSLQPDVNQYEVKNLDAGSYWFKVTQKDQAGNESVGVVKKIVLSETGPELIGLLLFSIGAGTLFKRKK